MKVAVLTMFSGLSTTYSLVNVAADQIKMLLDNGVEVRCLSAKPVRTANVSESMPTAESSGKNHEYPQWSTDQMV